MENIDWFTIALYIPMIGVVLSILSIIKAYLTNIVNLKRICNYENYETLAEYYYQKAYTIIYKDNILVYSVEGMSPKEEDVKKIQHKYLELIVDLMGEWMIEQFERYYGDRHAFYINALTFFDINYEDDAVKESAINKQMQEQG